MSHPLRLVLIVSAAGATLLALSGALEPPRAGPAEGGDPAASGAGDPRPGAGEPPAALVTRPAGGPNANPDERPYIFFHRYTVQYHPEGDGPAPVVVRLTRPSSQTVTVRYTTKDAGATSPDDYTAVEGLLTFQPGQTSQTILVPVVDDTVPEADKAVSIELSQPRNAHILDLEPARLLILDDDGRPGPRSHVNLAPVQTVPVSLVTATNTPLAFSVANKTKIAVDDRDAGNRAVRVDLSVSGGTLTLSGTGGLTFVGGGNGTAAMTFRATLAAANAALEGMTYTPPAGFAGDIQLTVSTDDLGNTGTGGAKSTSNTATIRVGLFARDDAYGTTRGQSFVAGEVRQGVLANDSDPFGKPLTASLIGKPAHGTVALNGDGTFQYTPRAGYVGDDSFTYRAWNGTAYSNVATVTVSVEDPSS